VFLRLKLVVCTWRSQLTFGFVACAVYLRWSCCLPPVVLLLTSGGSVYLASLGSGSCGCLPSVVGFTSGGLAAYLRWVCLPRFPRFWFVCAVYLRSLGLPPVVLLLTSGGLAVYLRCFRAGCLPAVIGCLGAVGRSIWRYFYRHYPHGSSSVAPIANRHSPHPAGPALAATPASLFLPISPCKMKIFLASFKKFL